jgi:hypothetical protein
MISLCLACYAAALTPIKIGEPIQTLPHPDLSQRERGFYITAFS